VNLFFNSISIISLLAVAYLIFLFYRKEKASNNPASCHASGLKIKTLRFNPFNDIGGNQSFVICILDENNNGCLLTSLHNRENTRTYAKEVFNGQPTGKNVLSKEEKECLQKALNNS
jgi:hypothetical protein